MDVTVACLCPPVEGRVRHEAGDTITIRDRLDFKSAAAIRSSLAFGTSDDEGARSLELLALLTESYVLFGVESWSLVDEGGPVPVSHGAIRRYLLENVEAASLVAERADELYSPIVLLPLVARASTSSRRTPTNGSTSRRTDSSSKRPTRSSRSSTRTTRTGATGTTTRSPGGGSNTSPNAASVD